MVHIFSTDLNIASSILFRITLFSLSLSSHLTLWRMANATSDRKKWRRKKDAKTKAGRFVTLLLIIKDTNPASFFFLPSSSKIGDSWRLLLIDSVISAKE